MEPEQKVTDKSDSYVVKATNVPLEFFQNRDAAKRYFRRFGKFILLAFRPKRSSLFIEYANEDSMLNALAVAGEYQGHVFRVTRVTEALMKKKKPKKDPDPDWTDDPDVKSELQAMGAFGPTRTYDLRAEAMIVDSPPEPARRWKNPAKKSGEHSDLLKIIRQQASTIEEKYRILDARDKLIRIKMKKNIALSKATVGTCPDMCPEKERLMRETQHQVALYEQEDEGKAMNPRLAVKQYSRSSADQEAPLPQELRPVHVLQMTMGYLLHRIVDLCDSPDVNTAEWYHFLWDRTRGIRKDITQQELCCQGSVELVEQCARFHIFCSARLVAEDPAVFDQKINTENLTKCLQTLKYMYHDLLLKGESCSNEAEFRAYVILLNLNDGNFMWEVQQLRDLIQKSDEVKFALEVHSSLDKRNYVKFFKLVESTTFLNACILMRYFVQVRLTAIKTLLKSYSPRVSQASLPVPYLTKILAFESTEACIEFCETYGLYTDVERSRIVLDMPSFSAPEYPYVLDRAFKLVESKRRNLVGEVVCGKQLPEKTYETHVPQDSFDSDGFLLYEEVDSGERNDEETTKRTAPSTKSLFVMTQPKLAPVNSVFGSAPVEEVVTAGDSFKREVDDEERKRRAEEAKREEAERLKRKHEEELRLRLEQQERERRRLREIEAIRLVKERERADLERKRAEIEKARAEAERARAEAERKYAEIERKRALLLQERRRDNEIKAAVACTVKHLLEAVEEDVKRRKLVEIAERIARRKLKKAVDKWRENSRRKRKRKALDFNPLWCGARSLQEEVDELKTVSQNLVLASIKRYKRGVPFEAHLKENDDGDVKIDLSRLYKSLTKRLLEVDEKVQRELFWKVTISLPDDLEFKSGLNHLEKTLDGYVRWSKTGSTTVLVEQSKTVPTVTYCLEKQKGLLVASNNETHGFVFFAHDINDDLMKRIVENLQNFGLFVKIPIVLALERYDKNDSNLKALSNEGIISDYLIIVDRFTSKNLTNMLQEALLFLSTRVEKSPPLQLDTLHSFLMKHLCSGLWKRANSFAKWNSNYKNCLKNPNTVIYLYNEALQRLKTICVYKSRSEHLKFPRIFKQFLRNEIPDSLPCDYKYFPTFWDHPDYNKHLGCVFDSLRFPNLLSDWPPRDPIELETSVLDYCKRLVKNPTRSFYKAMSIVLRDINPHVNFNDVKDVVWTEIVEVLCLEKLHETDLSLYGTGFVNQSIYNKLVVVYDVNSVEEFATSDWFYVNHPIVKQKISQNFEGETVETASSEQEDEEVDIDAIYNKLTRPRGVDVRLISSEVSGCKKMLSDLEESVMIHRKILEKSGDLLRTILDES